MDLIYVRIRKAMVPEWFTHYYAISQLVVLFRIAGKRDEIPYAEAFMLLHQEKKESEDYRLMVWRSEGKLNRVPIQKGLNKIEEIKSN